MAGWTCGIDGCGHHESELESLLAHQVSAHERHECKVCGSVVPEGFFAIKHAFEEHTRADYVRHYDADADDIRERENLLEAVTDQVDVAALRERLEVGEA